MGTCTDLAWGTPKDSSIFNEQASEEEADDPDDETEYESDTHPCSPAEVDLVLMVREKVIKINKNTKRSSSTIDQVRDITLELLEKVAKIEDVVDKIQDETTKTQTAIGKVEERIEETLDMNTELVNDLEHATTKKETKEESTTIE